MSEKEPGCYPFLPKRTVTQQLTYLLHDLDEAHIKMYPNVTAIVHVTLQFIFNKICINP